MKEIIKKILIYKLFIDFINFILIRINCVNSGGINDNQPKLFIKRYRQSCNSKGLLDGEDISKLILFLLSDKSKYITGQNLIIDDGWSL